MHVNAVSYYVVIKIERGSRVWPIATGRWWVYVHLSVTSTTTTPSTMRHHGSHSGYGGGSLTPRAVHMYL